MRSTRTRFLIAVLALIALVAGAAAGPASADRLRPPGAKAKKIKKALERRLERRKLDNVDIRRCLISDQKVRGKNAVECTWYAEGILPGEQPYRCHGDSLHGKRSDGKVGFIRISVCVNQARTQIPIAPTPVSEPLFGFNDQWVNATPQQFDLADRLEPDFARSGLDWSVVERQRGSYNWSTFDRAYAHHIERNIRPVWVIVNPPCFAQESPASCQGKRPAPEFYDEMADFAAAAARRYPQIGGLEVLNEPNLGKYWGGVPEPDLYAELFKKVEAAVREADPELPVLFGALGPHAESDENTVAAAEFLQQGYDLGAVQRSDGISTHPYPGTAPGEDHGQAVAKRLGDLWEVMSLARDTDRPLWITETGVSTFGDRAFTGEGQGEALVAIYDLVRRVEQVDVLIFHRFRDAEGDNVMEPGYGSVDRDLVPKPAYCALGATRGLNVC